MTKRFWLGITALAIAAAAVGYYQFGDVSAEVPVLISAEATGRLEAVTTVQVGSQVSGSIERLYADFNSTVRQGQVIAELDPSLFATQVEQAEATVTRLASPGPDATTRTAAPRCRWSRSDDRRAHR